MNKEKRYALCGLSIRGLNVYAEPLLGVSKNFRLDTGDRLVAIVDPDRQRVEAFNEQHGLSLPVFDSIEAMLGAVHPDGVIVAGPDYTHADQIVAALRHGCEVIAEKPLVIDFAQAAQVRQAVEEAGRDLRMGFNFRYAPLHKAIKGLLLEGRVGRVTTVNLNYSLDTFHGSSYFYRWNRYYRFSGGLAVTKSCHHYDLLNWWLDDLPVSLVAEGDRFYYGADSPHDPRRTGEPDAKCPYKARWARGARDDHISSDLNITRLPNEWQYPADKPWSIYDDDIDVEDAYSSLIRYRKGAVVSYTCDFSTPWEGYTLSINGTHGKIEAHYISDPSRCPFPCAEPIKLYFTPLFGTREEMPLPEYKMGGHGGADEQLLKSLFSGISLEEETLGLVAGSEAGLIAAEMGAATGLSIREGRKFTWS